MADHVARSIWNVIQVVPGLGHAGRWYWEMRWVTLRGVALEEVSGLPVRSVPLSVILETYKDGQAVVLSDDI